MKKHLIITLIAIVFAGSGISASPASACMIDNLGPMDCAKRCIDATGFVESIICTLGSHQQKPGQ